MDRITRTSMAVALMVSASACNPGNNLDEAADQIDRFQNLFSNGYSDEMRLMGSPNYRKTISAESLDLTVAFLKRRLGSIERSERESFSINTTPQETRTVVVMATRFELGAGTETYTLVGNGEMMRIEGWRVDSPQLTVAAGEMERLERSSTAPEPAD